MILLTLYDENTSNCLKLIFIVLEIFLTTVNSKFMQTFNIEFWLWFSFSPISKVKRLPSEWEEIIANETTDKELISKIYKQLNSRKTNDPIRKQADQEMSVLHGILNPSSSLT